MNTPSKWIQVIFAVLLFFTMISCSARDKADLNPVQKAWTREQLATIVENWRIEANLPGVAVGISLPGNSDVFIASGESDVTGHIALNASDQFHIASISKTFIAAEILRLAEKGRIGLDDPLNDYLPNTPYGDIVTIRHLLSHRSGYFDLVFDDPEFISSAVRQLDKRWTTDEILTLVFEHEPVFEPGTAYEYSNTNYLLLGLVIEKITQQPLGQVLTEDIFAPFRLNQTFYRTVETNISQTSLVHGYDSAFLHDLGDRMDVLGVPNDAILTLSNNSIVSNAPDLIAWARILFGNDSTMLAPAYKTQMLTFADDGPYGLGVERSSVLIGDSLGHSGSAPGYLSLMEYYPDQDMVMVILVNANVPSAHLSGLRDQILSAIFDIENEQNIKAWIANLSNEDASVRKDSISALGHSGTHSIEAIQGLIRILKEDVVAENRKEAALALGIVGENSSEARQALTDALKDPDAGVREAAGVALGVMK
jgi:D-alanyl-D-alanine carboxypeptidase